MTRAAPTIERYVKRLAGLHASKRDQQRLRKILLFCAGLPECAFEPFGQRHIAIKVARKTFAYHLHQHHDDGRVCICCKSSRERQEALVGAHAERFFAPPYLGVSGWVSLRVDLPRIAWDEVFELLVVAYRLQAPRRLAAEME